MSDRQISLFCICLSLVLDSIEEVWAVTVADIQDCESLLKAYEMGGIPEVQQAVLNMANVSTQTDEIIDLAMTFIDKNISKLI